MFTFIMYIYDQTIEFFSRKRRRTAFHYIKKKIGTRAHNNRYNCKLVTFAPAINKKRPKTLKQTHRNLVI
jgi:hypothetical protein